MESNRYVSSYENKTSQVKLNNVIQSLNDYIDNSTNDETNQDFGTIKYEGKLTVGSTLHGNKRPKRAGNPIVYRNTLIGILDDAGNCKVLNNKDVYFSYYPNNVAWSNTGVRLYFENLGNSYTRTEHPEVVSTEQINENVSVTSFTNETDIKDIQTYYSAYPGMSLYENATTWLTNHGHTPRPYTYQGVTYPAVAWDSSYSDVFPHYELIDGEFAYVYEAHFKYWNINASHTDFEVYTDYVKRIVKIGGGFDVNTERIETQNLPLTTSFDKPLSIVFPSSTVNYLALTFDGKTSAKKTVVDYLRKEQQELENISLNVRYY